MSVESSDEELWIETSGCPKAGRLKTVRLPGRGETCAVVDLQGVPIKYEIVYRLRPDRARALGAPFGAKIRIDGGDAALFRCNSSYGSFSAINGRYLGFAPVKTSETGSLPEDTLMNLGKIEIELCRCTETGHLALPRAGALVGDTALAPEGKKMFRATTISMGSVDLKPAMVIEFRERLFTLELHYASRMSLELQGILTRELPDATAASPARQRTPNNRPPARQSRASDVKRPSQGSKALALVPHQGFGTAGIRPASSPLCIDLTGEDDELAGHARLRVEKRMKVEILD
eukprot:jgi/Mesvir1/8962/Mv19769-RA.1